MLASNKNTQFSAEILRPVQSPEGGWGFVLLPGTASDMLPRRGRISVSVCVNAKEFIAMLEPDGQKGHWLKLDKQTLDSSDLSFGHKADFTITLLSHEPEPELPEDFSEALVAAPAAKETWSKTTPIAQVDWIHWIESAKQAKTRDKRISDACDMLAEGKTRVCCFDSSGFYSKAFRAPESL